MREFEWWSASVTAGRVIDDARRAAAITIAAPTVTVRDSETVRMFNTTHVVPLGVGEFHRRLFERTDAEIISLPSTVDTLFETYPERAREAISNGHLALRTRDELPYGLALFDDRVGIGGYDESTGLMQVFVDTDSPIAREWSERVYASVRADSEALDERADRRG